ncbi:hypothetical protein [Actinotalea subterranea]|uniref:hypothetical protein n=1 Tax=Actinotalea subterranea TaxID=2607497 RepID=UPI0011EFFA2F|nr:hypothetical protein [Actinotalea subterranea]
MWNRRRAALSKGLVALAASAGIGAYLVPQVLLVYDREWPDQGVRPLIIIATQGGGVDYSVEVRANVSTSGDLRFTFYLRSDDASTAQKERPHANVQVVAIGDGVETGVRCGAASGLTSVDVEALSPGPAHAYAIDQVAARWSATNYRPDSPTEPSQAGATAQAAPPPSPAPGEGEAPAPPVPDAAQYAVEMWGWYSDERAWDSRSLNETGLVFVEECTVDAALMWSSASPDAPMSSPQATFFPPQFNLTSIDATTDHQTDLGVWIQMDRPPGATLAESYPTPATAADGWSLWYDVQWNGTLGSTGNLAYTDQPTWLMVNRDAARDEQSWLLFGGLGLGLFVTLLVRALSDLVDSTVPSEVTPQPPDPGATPVR